MAVDPGAIDAALAAAVGDDPALIAELRTAFVTSARRALSAIEAAGSDEDWREATGRLKGLAASFGAVRLVALATEATRRPAGEAAMVRKLKQAIARL